MDYWAETMQDDCYLIAADGWKAGAQPREIRQVKNKDNKLVWPETHDYKKGKRRFKSDLVPAPFSSPATSSPSAHGFDAGKKIKGKKRHILVDTQGLMLQAIVHAADIQDRDGGAMLMATLFGLYPFLLKLYADGGYQGPEFRNPRSQNIMRAGGLWRSSSGPTRPKGSWFCPNAGSWNERSHGSIDAAGWPRTGNVSTVRRARSCSSHRSALWYDG